MYEECERFCKIESHARCLKRFRKIVMYIRSNSWFERYQADTVELNNGITHNHAYPYLIAIVDHNSKYGFAYAIPVKKKAETIKNYMMQAL